MKEKYWNCLTPNPDRDLKFYMTLQYSEPVQAKETRGKWSHIILLLPFMMFHTVVSHSWQWRSQTDWLGKQTFEQTEYEQTKIAETIIEKFLLEYSSDFPLDILFKERALWLTVYLHRY